MNPGPIDGIRKIAKKRILDQRGGVFHMLRRDDPEFIQFGEIYFSQINPGMKKGWHLHQKSVGHYLILMGRVMLSLYDERKDSPTFENFAELTLSSEEGELVQVPPLVWYAFHCVGDSPALIANCSTEPHHPQESVRRPIETPPWGLSKQSI